MNKYRRAAGNLSHKLAR